MRSVSKSILFVLVFGVLAACQSTSKTSVKETGFHVVDVAVIMPDQSEKSQLLRYTDGFQAMMKNTISHHAAEYNATRPNANKAYALNVDITDVHFKNALVSLLVGDANRISGEASLVDTSTGATVHTMPVLYVDAGSAALNGISGAVLSVVVKKEAAEGTLSKGVANRLMKLIYPDTKVAETSLKRLRGKTVYQPMTTAMSPLVTTENETVELEVTETGTN